MQTPSFFEKPGVLFSTERFLCALCAVVVKLVKLAFHPLSTENGKRKNLTLSSWFQLNNN